MSTLKLLNVEMDDFSINAAIIGYGNAAIVIGSSKYYPQTFSNNLSERLQLICCDTRAFALEIKNHNEGDYTIDKVINDIEIVRKSLHIKKPIIIGHSIHAFMAMEYARRFPENVSHLVMIASSPIAGPELYKIADQYFQESVCPERKIAFEHSMQQFGHSIKQSLKARMLAFGPMLWFDYHFDASQQWENVEVNAIGANVIWGPMFTNHDTPNALKEIKCPIFLALGRYDYFNPPHLWEVYRHYAADLTIRVFEKSGHTPQFEEADNFDAELLKWLQI